MFSLKSRLLRRRLSAPTSGSAKRRARERRQAQQTRAEGERIAQQRREHRIKEKFEQQRLARDLAPYEPWGRAGGGAPNPHGVRYSNLRAGGIYPEDELKGVAQYEACHRWPSPRRRYRSTPRRLREDPQLCYADSLRKSVDNDIRYRQTTDQQNTYKQILDEMVDTRKKTLKNELRQNVESERKLQAMEGPWGKPGPGGTTWRNPRDVGLNFSKSMGWTDNDLFDKIKGDHRRKKRSSLTLPKVKKADETPAKERIKPSSVEKLPDIRLKSNSDEEKKREDSIQTKSEFKSNCSNKAERNKNEKIVKRLNNGERVARVIPDVSYKEFIIAEDKKPTPETAILSLTGGIELVPLLARRRLVGPRTLHSSDVTRPPEEYCQWRELLNTDYLRELKNQIRVKCEQEQESRLNSAEGCMRHHETWASLWGRPGHGAPQRGRYARNNLARLLYIPPLAPAV